LKVFSDSMTFLYTSTPRKAKLRWHWKRNGCSWVIPQWKNELLHIDQWPKVTYTLSVCLVIFLH